MSIFDLFRIRIPLSAKWKKYYNDDDLNINIPNVSMYDQVRMSASKYPDYTAIRYFNQKIKYKKFIKLIDKCADSFTKKGIKKGDIVTLCMPNIPDVLICLYALNKIGAVANMLHPLSAEEEIKRSLIDTKSKILVVVDVFYNKVKNIITSTPTNLVVLASAGDYMGIFMGTLYKIKNFRPRPQSKRYTRFKYFMNLKIHHKQKYVRYGSATPAVILNSGGTSGKPKHVVLQNRAFILQAIQDHKCLDELVPGDSSMAIMPNFHGFGLSLCMHTALTFGAHTILIPQFDGKKFDILFNKYKPSVILGVPTLYEALVTYENLENADFSFLKYAICGGDTLSSALEDKVNEYLKKRNANCEIRQGYGLSEALAAVCLNPKGKHKKGSIGIPMPGNYIKIVSTDDMKEQKTGEVGEIVVNTKGLMMGYLNNEAETNDALRVHKDGHVWLHTGDLGYMDKDGYIFYMGRTKKMIITSGYNVYPEHIEEVLEGHPAVLSCTVVGVPHPYKQEVCKAFIVLNKGYHGILVKNDIKEYAKKNLAKYMVPYQFVYRKGLPKTLLGKVDFNALKSDIGVDDKETD